MEVLRDARGGADIWPSSWLSLLAGLGLFFIENYAKAYEYTDPRTRIPCSMQWTRTKNLVSNVRNGLSVRPCTRTRARCNLPPNMFADSERRLNVYKTLLLVNQVRAELDC